MPRLPRHKKMAYCRRKRGMTLVELLIVMVVMAVVTAASAAIMSATSLATESRNDLRKMVVRANVLEARLKKEIHNALAILDVDKNMLVLWAKDTNESNTVNLDELVLIQLDLSGSVMRHAITWPGVWTQDQINTANTEYAASSDFSAIAQAAVSNKYFAGQPWSTSVNALSFTLDNVSPSSANMVTINATITADSAEHKIMTVASLRTRQVPE